MCQGFWYGVSQWYCYSLNGSLTYIRKEEKWTRHSNQTLHVGELILHKAPKNTDTISMKRLIRNLSSVLEARKDVWSYGRTFSIKDNGVNSSMGLTLFLKVNNDIPEHKSSKDSKSIELCELKGMSKGILKEYVFHFSICVYLFEDKTGATFIAYIRYSINLWIFGKKNSCCY